MSKTDEDVGKGAAVALTVAAGACAFTGPAAGFCEAGVAIAAALTKFGIWISSEFRDTFHVDKATSEAWLIMFRIHPALAFLDVDKADNAIAGADLARYFLITSGETPIGKKGNNGKLNNPNISTACDNPYQCSEDSDEPLTSGAILQDVYNRYRAWVDAGGGRNLSALSKMVPTLHRHPAEAQFLLAAIRNYPNTFKQVAQWSEITANINQVQEQLRAMRLIAGEDGPDPGGVLQGIFGGDLTVHQASRDPSLGLSFLQVYPYTFDKSKGRWVMADQTDNFYRVAVIGTKSIGLTDEYGQEWWMGAPSTGSAVKWDGTAPPGPGTTGTTDQYLPIWKPVPGAALDFSAPTSASLPPGAKIRVLQGPVGTRGQPVAKTASGPGSTGDKTAGYLVLGGAVALTLGAFAFLATRPAARPTHVLAFSWDTWRAKYAELPPDVLAKSAEAFKLTPVAEAAEASGVAKSWLDNPGDPEHWDAHQAHHDAHLGILGFVNNAHREPSQAAPEEETDAEYEKRVKETDVVDKRFRDLLEAHEKLANYHMAKKYPAFKDTHHPPSHDEAMALVRKYG